MNHRDKARKHSDPPTLGDHPGLDNDEATDEGKMMTASGSLGPAVNHDANDEERDQRAEDGKPRGSA